MKTGNYVYIKYILTIIKRKQNENETQTKRKS